MKTIKDRIQEIINNNNINLDEENTKDIEKIIYIAYWMGIEEGTKTTSDEYKEKIQNMRDKANKHRYYKMINNIIGEEDYIYNPNYSKDITCIFGSDETEL